MLVGHHVVLVRRGDADEGGVPVATHLTARCGVGLHGVERTSCAELASVPRSDRRWALVRGRPAAAGLASPGSPVRRASPNDSWWGMRPTSQAVTAAQAGDALLGQVASRGGSRGGAYPTMLGERYPGAVLRIGAVSRDLIMRYSKKNR